jgi:hypothetical protein
MEKQVFRRVSANAEFGKYDEIGSHFIASTICVLEDSRRVTGDIANNQVKLSEGDDDFIGQGEGALVVKFGSLSGVRL